mmetsp:Transcript_25329/g.62714  ORF Transcript_25329/g.62714 Transcript_25329/m.62714 type:complete len:154 (+) Transcript_25329:1010-1471(+)
MQSASRCHIHPSITHTHAQKGTEGRRRISPAPHHHGCTACICPSTNTRHPFATMAVSAPNVSTWVDSMIRSHARKGEQTQPPLQQGSSRQNTTRQAGRQASMKLLAGQRCVGHATQAAPPPTHRSMKAGHPTRTSSVLDIGHPLGLALQLFLG